MQNDLFQKFFQSFANDNAYFALIITASLIACIRVVPVLLLSKRQLPVAIQNTLVFIPTAIMSTIVVSEIIKSNAGNIFYIPIALLAAIISFILSYITKNLFVAIIASVVAYVLLTYYETIFSYLRDLWVLV